MSAWNYVIQIIAAQKKQNAARNAEAQAQQAQITDDTRLPEQNGPLELPDSTTERPYTMLPEMANSGLKSFMSPMGVTGASGAATAGGGGEMGEGMTGALEGGMDAYGAGAGAAGDLGPISVPADMTQGGMDAFGASAGGTPGAAKIDVMGGADIGEKSRAAAAKTSPAVQDYIKNAMQEYVRQKMAKKFGGMAGAAAAAANTGSEGSRGEFGQKINALSDWLNETPANKRARKKGLYAQP